MKKPNFFIVGAPKCGTTALWAYLRAHPNIYMPDCKEPHFFAGDFDSNPCRSLAQYESLFGSAYQTHIAVGEASAGQMFSRQAARNIWEYAPTAKIIAMVRNPVEMAQSLHAHLQLGFCEDEPDCEKAWDLQEIRGSGKCIPKHCPEPKFLQYSQVCRLGEQLERYVELFPPEQMKVVVFDDFKADTRSVYENVLEFLEVPSDGRIEFPRVNERKAHRLRALAKTCVVTKGPWPQIRKLIKAIVGKRTAHVIARVLVNTYAKPVAKMPLNPEFRARLAEEFRDDVEKLGNVIGRDLNHWLQAGPK